jgi:hypothetical protein
VSFIIIMAVYIAIKKEAGYNYIFYPRSRPIYIISIYRDLNLTSKLAKLGLYISGLGRVSGIVRP